MKLFQAIAPLFVFALFLFSATCKDELTSVSEKQTSFVNINDTLQKINNALLITDKERMETYSERMGYTMQSSPSGLFYDIYLYGKGKSAQNGNLATFNFRIELLDGTLCYSSENQKPKTVKIGQSGEQVGLDEALLLLHEGDKAHFLMPPYLAHGLLGDMDKIPGRSILYYHIELLKLTDK